MKWMLGTTLGAFLAMSAATGAQSAKGMETPMKGGMTEATYTGCVEAGAGDSLVLTHVGTGQQMPMKGKEMSMKAMDDDHMMPKTLRLVGSPSLAKHTGQRVSIKGSSSHDTMEGMHEDQPAVKVVSFKVVSKSCS